MCGGKMEHEEQNKQAEGYTWGRGVGGGELMAPALQRGENMSLWLKMCFWLFCADVSMCVSEQGCALSSRLKMTSQSEALLGPIQCSPNLQMTLGILSTYDESLPSASDLFNPAKSLGSQDTNHLDGSHEAAMPWASANVCMCVCVCLFRLFVNREQL